jgi:uncharacterized protein YfeS
MPNIDVTKQPSTYQQHKNQLEHDAAAAEFVRRHQEMILDEAAMFSKNQLDVAVARAIAKQFGYILLAFLCGLSVSMMYIILHLK